MKHALLALTFLVAHLNISLASERPNIVLIMVDDMGFSDLGCYGSEIQTPNIDKLAAEGVRFSHFYNGSRCCPTRASLMTGLHPHLTGIGHMTNPPPPKQAWHDAGPGFPSYRGVLNRQCATLAEMLRPAGYATFIAGKWHLGGDRREYWPLQRGFDRFYGCLAGATRFFLPLEPRHMTRDNEYIVEPQSTTDASFYTTDAFTDQAIQFIRDERSDQGRPFFLYLAYTAPHWPHQAHQQDIDKYQGQYMSGWDVVRRRRYEKQIRLGLIDPKWKLSPRPEDVPEWTSLDRRKQIEMDLRMAVYAAMIDRVDQNIGKLVQTLQKDGVADKTMILFLSDNGACAEGPVLGRGAILDQEARNQQHANNYGAAWAHVSSTPFRLYKHYTHEGGAATPFFIRWPDRIKSLEAWYTSPAQLIDIVPTLLAVAGATYPETLHGHQLPPLRGVSLAPAFDATPIDRQTPMFSEHEDNAFIFENNWKLVGREVSTHDGPKMDRWELYNLADDRTELSDLSTSHTERVERMSAQWSRWATDDKVYPKPKQKSFSKN